MHPLDDFGFGDSFTQGRLRAALRCYREATHPGWQVLRYGSGNPTPGDRPVLLRPRRAAQKDTPIGLSRSRTAPSAFELVALRMGRAVTAEAV